jgi:tRNA-binding EMAP/Myf-like protein
MKQGFTVATLGSPPIEFVGKKLGFVVLVRADELFSYPSSGLIVSVKRSKSGVTRSSERSKRASRPTAIFQNREGTIRAMMEWMKIDRDMAAATYTGIVKTYGDDLTLPEDGLRPLIDEAKKMPN